MKLSLIASVSAFTTENRVSRDVEEKGVKRYSQLEDMMFHYNPDFDERKYWSYGCHCLMLGESILTTFFGSRGFQSQIKALLPVFLSSVNFRFITQNRKKENRK